MAAAAAAAGASKIVKRISYVTIFDLYTIKHKS